MSVYKKKKVCHMTSAHAINDTRIFLKECRTLERNGYNVVLVAQNDGDIEVEGVSIRGIPRPKSRLQRMIYSSQVVYRRAVAEEADAYHFHDPELIPAALLLKIRGKRVIYDVHEDVPLQTLSKEYIAKPLRKLVAWFIQRIENFAAKRFDGVIGATPFITKRFSNINKRTVNVNNYPLLDELFCNNVEWGTKNKATSYVGAIAKIRGAFQMVESIGLTQYQLFMAGNFSDSEERSKSMRISGWDQVIEMGQLARNEVADMLSKTMAGLVLFHPEPNHVDAQPNKMFEYMSAGIPVIASDFPLWKEIVEGNECGLCVDPMDTKAIAEAISWIIEHPNNAENMGRNGRLAVEKIYNWNAEEKKLISLYEELLR